jgi:hypothetical protein
MRPIYASNGEWVALLAAPYLFDTCGEWIGWLVDREVYSLDGLYVGQLTQDGRIVRPRVRPSRPQRPRPPAPPRVHPPATVPLAPMFAELPWRLLDVFEEEPEVFRFVSDLRPDWED